MRPMAGMETEKIIRDINRKSGMIADILGRGRDVEIRKSKDGISVAEVTRKVVKK